MQVSSYARAVYLSESGIDSAALLDLARLELLTLVAAHDAFSNAWSVISAGCSALLNTSASGTDSVALFPHRVALLGAGRAVYVSDFGTDSVA